MIVSPGTPVRVLSSRTNSTVPLRPLDLRLIFPFSFLTVNNVKYFGHYFVVMTRKAEPRFKFVLNLTNREFLYDVL